MNPRELKTIGRILKVNHAGEYGAIRIYGAQLWFARRWHPNMVDFLEETLGHEIRHCQEFRAAMPGRNTRPCRVMSLWGNGGYVLGALTACFGAQSIWVCTSAVEETVHKHMLDQLTFLEGKDSGLTDLINSIMAEELHHLEYVNSKIVNESRPNRFLRSSISIVTEVLIWLSTWGDSQSMAREISRKS